MNPFFKFTTIAALLIYAALMAAAANAATNTLAPAPVSAPMSEMEIQARRVDQVALHSQDLAAGRLKALIRKYRGTAQEPILIMRLAQVDQESAGIEFRITYARGQGAKSTANIQKYHSRLSDSVRTINELLAKYPRFSEVDRALFIRGKALQELGQVAAAKRDYLTLTSQHPYSTMAIASYMALAEIAIEANNHPEAISYLRQVEAHTEDPHYPFALYKLAWSYFNLKDIAKALSYAERHVRYVKPTDASRENCLLDLTVFYFEGFEQDRSQYSVQSAWNFFGRLAPPEILAKMNIRFAKLLRSHLHENELIFWKNKLIEETPRNPETMEVVLILFEHQWNQNHFDDLNLTAQDITNLFKRNKGSLTQSPIYITAQKTLIEKAEKLQEFVTKNSGQSNAHVFMKSLKEIYSAFISVVSDSDPRISQAHYNLAETSFKTSDFEGATEHYRWILSHWQRKAQLTRADVELKAISSRYETLRRKGLIPQKIVPGKMDQASWSDRKDSVKPELREWIDWIDSFSGDHSETFANFAFEANRAIYQNASVHAATERLTTFAKKHPESKYAIASQELVLDSLIQTGNWNETYRITQDFLRLNTVETPFRARLSQLSADASFKLIESDFQSNDLKNMISKGRAFAKNFPKNPRVADILYLLATASLKLNDNTSAQGYFSNLIRVYPDSPLRKKALLARAQLLDQAQKWDQAAADYQELLKTSDEKTDEKTQIETPEIQKRLVFLQWINGQPISSCSQMAECSQYKAMAFLKTTADLSIFTQPGQTEPVSKLRSFALKGPKEDRALWSLVGLKSKAPFELREQLLLIRAVADKWDSIDSSFRLVAVATMNETFPDALARIRQEIRRANPLFRPSPKAVSLRAEWIKELEDTVAKIVKLPWYRLQATALSELAQAYDEFIENLSNAPIPKDLPQEEVESYRKTVLELVQPFVAKRDDIAERAVRTASEAAVEESVRRGILERFPKIAAKIGNEFQKKFEGKKIATVSSRAPLDYTLLERFLARESRQNPLAIQWTDTLRSKSWEKCAALLQLMTTNKVIAEHELKIMKATFLAAMGSQAESLIELQASIRSLDQSHQRDLASILLSYYFQAGSLENTLQLNQLAQVGGTRL